jgi:hypothetical protein
MEHLRRSLEVTNNSTDDDQIWGAECEAIFDIPRLATIIITAVLIFVQILQNFTEFVHLKIYLPKVRLLTYRETAVFLTRDQDLDDEARLVDEASSGATAFVASSPQAFDVERNPTQPTSTQSNHRLSIWDTHLFLFVRVKEDINPFQHLRESQWIATMALYLDRFEWILHKPTYPLLPLIDWIQKEKLPADIDVTSWNSSFLYGRSVGHLYCTLLVCMMLFCPVALYVKSFWLIVALGVGFLLFLVQVKLFCTGHLTHFFSGIVFGFLAALTWTPTGLLRNCFLSLLTVVYFVFLNIVLDFYIVMSWIIFFFDSCRKVCCAFLGDEESKIWVFIMLFFGFHIFYFGSALIAYGVLYAQLVSTSVFLIMNIIPFVAKFNASNGEIDGVFTLP